MYRIVGRVVSRGTVAGIFIPFKSMGGLTEGVYEVREIMDEISLVRLGTSAMPSNRLMGVDLQGLFTERDTSAMTEEEYKKLCTTE